MEDIFGSSAGHSSPMLKKPKRERAVSMFKTATREVFDYGHFDFNVLSQVPNQALLYNQYKSRLLVGIRILRLALSITTCIIVNTQMMEAVDPAHSRELGLAYRIVGNMVRFMAAPFFLMAILQFNNYYSERMYYKYLQCGAIIDYPPTSQRDYLLSHNLPRLFMIYFLLYFFFTAATMFTFKAAFGSLIIFSNAMGSILIFWFRQQSVESSFISLTDYIQSFPDADGRSNNIDDTSLTSAAHTLTKMTLVESATACYSSSMRNAYWKMDNFPGWLRWFLRFAVYAVSFGALGFAIWYSLFYSDRITGQIWEVTINPCIHTCADISEQTAREVLAGTMHSAGGGSGSGTSDDNSTSVPSTLAPSIFSAFNYTRALQQCYCTCLQKLSLTGYHRTCEKNLNLAHRANQSTVGDVCVCGLT